MRTLSVVTFCFLTNSSQFAQGAALIEQGTLKFTKDASQYCFSTLAPDRQHALYGRLLTLGASFTHGCMSCDGDSQQASFQELTDDSLWFRRNLFVHFLAHAPWKTPVPQGPFKRVAVYENSRTRPSALVPLWQAARDGYSGLWVYDPVNDVAALGARPDEKALMSWSPFADAVKLVGGFERRFDMEPRPVEQGNGILYQALPESVAQLPTHIRSRGYSGPQPLTIFDLSIDGSRMRDTFAIHGDATLFANLERQGWHDRALREQIIERAARRVAGIEPSLVFAIDALFWDGVASAFTRLRHDRSATFLTRLLFAITAQTPAGRSLFDEGRRQRQRNDYFAFLTRLSRGTGEAQKPIPVLLGRLLPQAGDTFSRKQYYPVIASLIAQLIEQSTGRNFALELAFWLARAARGELELSSANDNGPTFSAEDTQTAQGLLRDLNAKGKSTSALAGLVIAALGPDLENFIEALSSSFDEMNASVRAFTAQTDNNVHLIVVDDFLADFASFLKPETMHPSVQGARRMASLVNTFVCQSVGPQP